MDKVINQLDFLQTHIDALYTSDLNTDLLTVNEPWDNSEPASKFFLGRTFDGHHVSKFRFDIPDEIREKINALCQKEPKNIKANPQYLGKYLGLLKDNDFSISLCYYIPQDFIGNNGSTIVSHITRNNIDTLDYEGFSWLTKEIDYVQPCIGAIVDNKIVSLCYSVRISSKAYEAGVDTLEEFRGNGYALDVVAAWASAVRAKGILPLYSTLIENAASQRVAQKAGLYNYGIGFAVE